MANLPFNLVYDCFSEINLFFYNFTHVHKTFWSHPSPHSPALHSLNNLALFVFPSPYPGFTSLWFCFCFCFVTHWVYPGPLTWQGARSCVLEHEGEDEIQNHGCIKNSQGSSCLHLHRAGITGIGCSTSISTPTLWVLQIRTQAAMLVRQVLYLSSA